MMTGNDDETALTILRPTPTRRLRNALRRAVAADSSLASAQVAIDLPLRVLDALAQEARAVLRGDTGAMDRMHLLVSTSAPNVINVGDAMHAVATGEDANVRDGAHDEAHRCGPGIVHLGAAVVVAFAAGRVGRRQGNPSLLVDIVLGIAKSAAPAEAISRSLARGLSDEQLQVILSAFVHPRRAEAQSKAVLSRILDSCERSRWRCIEDLFREVKVDVDRVSWDAASSSVIGSTRRRGIRLSLRLVEQCGIKAGEAPLDVSKLERGQVVQVVLASPQRGPMVTDGRVTRSGVVAWLPDEAYAGWLGISTDETRRLVKADRQRLVRRWSTDHPCLTGAPVPTGLLQAAGLEPPALREQASWGVEIADLSLTQGDSDELVPGTPTEVAAELAPADKPMAGEIALSGGPRVEMTWHDGVVRGTLEAPLVVDGLTGSVMIRAPGSKRPDDERPFELRVARPQVPDNAIDAVLLRRSGDADVVVERRDTPSLRLGDRLLRHRELPMWATDEIWRDDVIDDLDGPGATRLIERLESLAARTSGLEQAMWIALVPGDRPLARIEPSFVARAIVVATPSGLERVRALPAETSPRTRRLRIVGRVGRGDVAITEPVRLEVGRAAGAGGQHPSEIVAVALDADRREVARQRITTVSPTGSGPFALLLAIDEAVRMVELRREPQLLAVELSAMPRPVGVQLRDFEAGASSVTEVRAGFSARGAVVGITPSLHQPAGRPSIEITERSDGTVQWRYEHSGRLRGRVEVEVGSEQLGVWLRVAEVDAGAGSASLPKGLTTAEMHDLRLVASDGWNVDVKPVPREEVF